MTAEDPVEVHVSKSVGPVDVEASAGFGLVVLVSAMTVSIVPFINSIATKAGEDAYESVKRLLKKNVRPGETGHHVRVLCLDDPHRNLHAHLTGAISDEEAAQLFRLDLDDPRIRDGDILHQAGWHFFGQDSHLSWHDERREWVDQPEHDLSKKRHDLLEWTYREHLEKREKYADFLAVFNRWLRLTDNIPERGQRNPDEIEAVRKAEDELEDSLTDLYFIASEEVLEVAKDIVRDAIQGLGVTGGKINHFLEVAREDLGVGGAVPGHWVVNRDLSDSDQDDL